MFPEVAGFHHHFSHVKPPSLLSLGMRLALLGDGSANRRNNVASWKREACLSSKPPPNSHFECTPDGDIKCLEGWAGDLCDVPQCKKSCDPMHGYCNFPGECKCKIGFGGPLCDACVPMLGCAHGTYKKSFECNCDPGWDGILCNTALCSSNCHPARGYCEKPGTCRCRLGWAGANCSDCQILPGCKNGFCNKPLECNCKPGWTGLLCQIPLCKQGCSKEHGYCEDPSECRCRVGWWGPDCADCFPYPGCTNGFCAKPWECKCKPGWTGFLCDKRISSCSLNPDFCLSGGTCVESGPDLACKCPEGTLGSRCEIRYAKNSTLEFPVPSIDARLAEKSANTSVRQAEDIISISQNVALDSVRDPTLEQSETTEQYLLAETTEVVETASLSSDQVALSIYKIVNRERPAGSSTFFLSPTGTNDITSSAKIMLDSGKRTGNTTEASAKKPVAGESKKSNETITSASIVVG